MQPFVQAVRAPAGVLIMTTWLMTLAGPAAFAAPAAPAAAAPAATAAPTASATPASEAPPTPAPASTATPNEEEQVIITGSRIARSGYQSPTPLTVIGIEDIQNGSPTNNLADFLNELPQVAGSTRPSNSRLDLSSGVAGLNTVNLRNLGETRTLVLIDGRRSPGSEVTGVVDVNTIPQGLVKNVEIVTGGASAAYGSDAVAGVVNFILDKNFTGLKVAADAGVTTYGDDFNYSASITGGFGFSGERGHVLISVEDEHRDGIFSTTRDWNGIGYRTINNPSYTATNGQPYYLVRYMTGTNNDLPGGIINSPTSLKGIYFGSNGAAGRFNYGTIASSTLSTGGDWDLADNSRNIGLDPSDDRHGVFARVSYEVASWIEVYGEVAYNEQTSLFNAGPQLLTATLQPDNAFLVNALGSAAIGGQTVSLGTTASELPYRKSNNSRSVQRYTLGADGDFQAFGKKAVWSSYVQYGQSDLTEQLRDIMNTSNIAAAEDAVFAPAGNALGASAGTIVCRSTLTAPSNGCAPLNLLGTNVASPAAISYVLGDPYRTEELQETAAGINLSVTPLGTWAGDVSVAVGAEYRREAISGYVPTEYQTGWSVGDFLPTFGSYDVKEAYVETVVPIGAGIELNGAARATDYSTSGYVTTWKAGATWQPVKDIRFRLTQSRDIRAPNLNELYQVGTSRTNTLLDPFNGQEESFRETTTGNLALKPEKADSTTAGVVLTPTFVRGLSLSVDWFDTKVTDAISQFYSQDIINLCYSGNQAFCAAYKPNPDGTTDFLFNASPFNAARLKVSGIDFDASYTIPLGPTGNLTFHGLASRYLDNTVDSGIQGAIIVNTVGQMGDTGTPKWIYRTSLTYDLPKWEAAVVARGVSAGNYANNDIQCTSGCPAFTANYPTVDDNHIAGAFYVDLNLTAKISDTRLGKMELFLNITNLFNRDPILLPEGGLSANTTYSDLLGRLYRVGVRMQW